MRGLRTTIALFVVLAGLSAYIYFVTSKAPDSSAPAPKDKMFPGVEASAINQMTVKADSGDTTTLKKDKNVWNLTAPVSALAEDMEVSQLTSNLSSLEIQRVVDATPSDLNQYGLQTPKTEIDFTTDKDKLPHHLFIGEKTPTGGDLFARRDNDKRVLLIPGYTETIFNRTTFDLRDKILVRFDKDKVDRVQMSADNKALEMNKGADNTWAIAKPIALPGDFGSIDGLLGRIQTAALRSVTSEQATPDELKKAGFDKPQASLVIGTGSMTQTIQIGGKVDDNTVYVRDTSKPLVGGIDVSFLKELQKGVDDFRRKELFESKGFNTDQIEFVRNGQSTIFERMKAKGTAADSWHRSAPNPGDPKTENMETLLAKLSNLRAASFEDASKKTGLDKPTLAVTVKFDDNKKQEHVTFAKTGDDVYASIMGQPGVAKVLTSEFDEAIKALDAVSK